MSNQSKAKEKQGYVPKMTPKACMHCASFRLDIGYTDPETYGKSYPKEMNLHCSIGGFAVKKMGTCNEWSPKV